MLATSRDEVTPKVTHWNCGRNGGQSLFHFNKISDFGHPAEMLNSLRIVIHVSYSHNSTVRSIALSAKTRDKFRFSHGQFHVTQRSETDWDICLRTLCLSSLSSWSAWSGSMWLFTIRSLENSDEGSFPAEFRINSDGQWRDLEWPHIWRLAESMRELVGTTNLGHRTSRRVRSSLRQSDSWFIDSVGKSQSAGNLLRLFQVI
jgi:hypothetical protein